MSSNSGQYKCLNCGRVFTPKYKCRIKCPSCNNSGNIMTLQGYNKISGKNEIIIK